MDPMTTHDSDNMFKFLAVLLVGRMIPDFPNRGSIRGVPKFVKIQGREQQEASSHTVVER